MSESALAASGGATTGRRPRSVVRRRLLTKRVRERVDFALVQGRRMFKRPRRCTRWGIEGGCEQTWRHKALPGAAWRERSLCRERKKSFTNSVLSAASPMCNDELITSHPALLFCFVRPVF